MQIGYVSRLPNKFIALNPNPQTVFFAGQYIRMLDIARHARIDPTHLSLILSGKRDPTMKIACKLALLWGMSLDGFMDSIKKRKEAIGKAKEALQAIYSQQT